MITNFYNISQNAQKTIFEYLENDKYRLNEIRRLVQNKILELDVHRSANDSFGSLVTVNYNPFSFNLTTIKSQGHTYTELISDLFRSIPKLKKDILGIIYELKTYAVNPHFRRGVDVELIHRKALFLISKILKNNKIERAKFRDDLKLKICFFYRIQHFLEHVEIFFEQGRLLNRYKAQFDASAFNKTFETLEGKAFLKRWVRFNKSKQFPFTFAINETEVCDFKRKYLNNSNKEVRTLARVCIKLKELNDFKYRYNNALYNLSALSLPIMSPSQGRPFFEAADDINFTSFKKFIEALKPDFNVLNEGMLELRKKFGNKFTDGLECPEFSDKHYDYYKKKSRKALAFLPTLKCLYSIFYETINYKIKVKKEIVDLFSPKEVLPLPSDQHKCQLINEDFNEMLESFDQIKDELHVSNESKENSQISEIRLTSSAPIALQQEKEREQAVKNNRALISSEHKGVDWKKVKPKTRKLNYHKRVLRWFDHLGKTHWLQASRDIQVHTFSSAIDEFVGSEYSLQDKWINPTTGKEDTRYRILAELIREKQTDWVLFQYTQSASDKKWYHRVMSFVVDEKFWHLIDFPPLTEQISHSKTKELSFEDHSERFDPETETTLLDFKSHQFRLYRLR